MGGGYAYNSSIPKTLKEALEKEGIAFISSISGEENKKNAYKAIFLDFKSEISKDIDGIDSNNIETDYSKIQTWCENLLNSAYSYSLWKKNKSNLVKYCSDRQPIKVESRLRRLGYKDWIKDDNQYKVIFSIYRFSFDFLEIINSAEPKQTPYIQTTKANDGFPRLKKWCTENLNLDTSKVEGVAIYSQLTWWCKPLGYDTIKGRIEKMYGESWKKESSSDVNANGAWDEIKELWKGDFNVKSYVKPGINQAQTVTAQEYKDWCDKTLNEKLYEDKAYIAHYKTFKSVCVEVNVQKKLKETKDLRRAIEEAGTK
ncbi:hypothetical protein [Candidatus Mycoplasma haematohominis]|uniref:hypothetical protein n=1 Tax=Candidatus Mycoplasma haematohominis TaxID=1494318 RepID=UPI001C0A75D9|nr:hypothetical protein [Candidatus Mycoplasma haemohominis]